MRHRKRKEAARRSIFTVFRGCPILRRCESTHRRTSSTRQRRTESPGQKAPDRRRHPGKANLRSDPCHRCTLPSVFVPAPPVLGHEVGDLIVAQDTVGHEPPLLLDHPLLRCLRNAKRGDGFTARATTAQRRPLRWTANTGFTTPASRGSVGGNGGGGGGGARERLQPGRRRFCSVGSSSRLNVRTLSDRARRTSSPEAKGNDA